MHARDPCNHVIRDTTRTGLCKTWTLDSGLDRGLDCGLEYGPLPVVSQSLRIPVDVAPKLTTIHKEFLQLVFQLVTSF